MRGTLKAGGDIDKLAQRKVVGPSGGITAVKSERRVTRTQLKERLQERKLEEEKKGSEEMLEVKDDSLFYCSDWRIGSSHDTTGSEV
jgi:hypothetical protein